MESFEVIISKLNSATDYISILEIGKSILGFLR